MDSLTFWIVVFLAAITLYRILSRRVVTPKSRVTELLRRYHSLEKTGLSEEESLLRLLATRKDWKSLPHPFLAELVARLGTKEDVMRFVSVSEDYRYHRDHYPRISTIRDLDEAMVEIACLFSRFGFELQSAERYKEAEFVQKLALRLQPNQYFTNLPLAATYHETGQYDAALPLFERGLAQLKSSSQNAAPIPQAGKCLGLDSDIRSFQTRYKQMYEACRKATAGKSA